MTTAGAKKTVADLENDAIAGIGASSFSSRPALNLFKHYTAHPDNTLQAHRAAISARLLSASLAFDLSSFRPLLFLISDKLLEDAAVVQIVHLATLLDQVFFK
jgi:hypothetical protein